MPPKTAKKAARKKAPEKQPEPVVRKPIRWRKVFIIATIVTILTTGLYAYWQREYIYHWASAKGLIKNPIKTPSLTEQEKWDLLRSQLHSERLRHAELYRSATTAKGKMEVIQQARDLLENYLPELMDCWLGTPWDFNGTASTPGQGKIACGYFVATILDAAGFQVSRISLAQQPSQNIIKTFLKQKDLSIRTDTPYKAFTAETTRSHSGIYIIGLDTHVGFLTVKNNTFTFTHSSGSKPWCVVKETPENANVIQRSNYRVTGNITHSDDVIRRWLLGEKFITAR